MSVCLPLAWKIDLYWAEIQEIWYYCIFRKSIEKTLFHYNMTNITGSLHNDQHTFMIISRWILLRMRNVSDKSCRENQNTIYVQWLLSEYSAVYEIMWKNMIQPDTPQNTNIDSRWCHWHNPNGRTVALGLTQPLREMSTRNISWEIKCNRCAGLTTPQPLFGYRVSWKLGA